MANEGVYNLQESFLGGGLGGILLFSLFRTFLALFRTTKFREENLCLLSRCRGIKFILLKNIYPWGIANELRTANAPQNSFKVQLKKFSLNIIVMNPEPSLQITS